MIAMTWKAFNHTYMRRSDAHPGVILCPAYACKHLLHMCDRRLRQDAVSEIEDEGPLGKYFEYVVHRAIERSAADKQRQRIEVSLHRHAPLDLITGKNAINRPIEADRIDRDVFNVAHERRADATRKSNHLRIRYVAAYFRDDALSGSDTPAMEFVRRQNAGPGIENLHRIRACLQLLDQITGGCIDELVDELGKSLRISIGKPPTWLLLRCAAARNHIAGDRPRCAAEAEQRHILRKLCFDPFGRLINRRKYAMVHFRPEPRQSSAIGNGIKLRSLTYSKLDRLPKRVGNYQNIREKDCCIEAKSAHRLKRHFSRKFWIKAELEKISRLFPHCPVFRQVANGLPHQPYGRRTTTLVIEDIEKRFIHRMIQLGASCKSKS